MRLRGRMYQGRGFPTRFASPERGFAITASATWQRTIERDIPQRVSSEEARDYMEKIMATFPPARPRDHLIQKGRLA